MILTIVIACRILGIGTGDDSMTTTNPTVRKLEEIAEELRREGKTDLAGEIGAVIADVKEMVAEPPAMVEPTGGVITTGEAAHLLGVRSINTVKRWAADGLLEGFRRGGRILISRASVSRLVDSVTIADQKRFEAEQDRAWDPFDEGDDAPLPPTPSPGQRPWNARAREFE
jgi:excisionase family DNA binding protein